MGCGPARALARQTVGACGGAFRFLRAVGFRLRIPEEKADVLEVGGLLDAHQPLARQFQDRQEHRNEIPHASGAVEQLHEEDGLLGLEAREEVLDGLLDGRIVVDDLARLGVTERAHDLGKGREEVPDLDALEEFVGGDLAGFPDECSQEPFVHLPAEPPGHFAAPVVQQSGGFLEAPVLDQLADQSLARVLFLLAFLALGRRAGQEGAALDLQKRRRHHDEVARQLDVQGLQQVEVGEVLVGDLRDLDLADIHLLALDEVQQEVHGAVVNIKFDLVSHRARDLQQTANTKRQ